MARTPVDRDRSVSHPRHFTSRKNNASQHSVHRPRRAMAVPVWPKALLFEKVSADEHHLLGRGVLSPVVDIGAFCDHIAGLIGSVRSALPMLCQAALHNISQRRTVFVTMKPGNSAR